MRRYATLLTLGTLVLLLAGGLLGRVCSPNVRSGTSGADASGDPATLLLISLDGFRWDYLDRYEAPTLARLASDGVRAAYLEPVFPTKTFPNHYTIVTGLYPSHHGIVGNTMYDPATDAWFRIGDPEAVTDARWWGGEPIWVTAEKQGRRSATYFWPGSEAPIQGVRPSYWKRFDNSIPGPQRVDEVLAWLDLPPAERPALITLYFSDVDNAGHRYGPDAPETADAVRIVDGYLRRLVDGLTARDVLDRTNLLLVSDHGMAATSPERTVVLDTYLDLEDVQIIERSPVLMVRPREGRESAVIAALRRAPHLAVYPASDIPDTLHFAGHPLIPPVIAVADEGWEITTRNALERNPERRNGGTHGYDFRAPSMGALFVAHGPAFPRGVRTGPISSVHLYNLMAALLDIEPAPNDGHLNAVRPLLRTEPVLP